MARRTPKYRIGGDYTDTLANVKKGVERAIRDYLMRYDLELVRDRHGNSTKEVDVKVTLRPH